MPLYADFLIGMLYTFHFSDSAVTFCHQEGHFFYFIYLRERIAREYSQLSSLTVANKRQLYLWAREGDTQQYFIFNGALKEERKIQTHLVFTTKDLRLKSSE